METTFRNRATPSFCLSTIPLLRPNCRSPFPFKNFVRHKVQQKKAPHLTSPLPSSQIFSSTPSTSPNASFYLTGLFEGFAEEEQLDLVVEREHTGSGNTTQDVGTGTLEERLDTLGLDDGVEGVERGSVLDGLTRGLQWSVSSRAQSSNSSGGGGGGGGGGLPSSCDDGRCPEDTRQFQHRW